MLNQRAWLILSAYIVIIIMTALGCEGGSTDPDEARAPDVSAAIGAVSRTTAECHGIITSDYGAPVTQRGMCWSKQSDPTLDDNKTSNGAGSGSYTSTLKGLEGITMYYVRAYATNEAGTGYSKVMSFTTQDSSGSVTDIDGNVYKTIKIGNQWWMAENLKATHYANGDPIAIVTDANEWDELDTGACCVYLNDSANVAVYGRLYNWYSVADARNIAPEGWHVPTDEEWKQMEMYLGMSQEDADDIGFRGSDEGNRMKEAGTAHWQSPNGGATNETGFTALPGSCRHPGGDFDNSLGDVAMFWTSTRLSASLGWGRRISCYDSVLMRYSYDKGWGFSVRCVKD